MQATTPTPSANIGELTSQVMVVVNPTAADACAPMRPTMAESAYCTIVASASSTMVGQASAQISASSARVLRACDFMAGFSIIYPPQKTRPRRSERHVQYRPL